jgi:histidinol-phosphate aminotransferase
MTTTAIPCDLRVTRRGFLAACIGTQAALALKGWIGEPAYAALEQEATQQSEGAGLARLHLNENPIGPSPAAFEAMQAEIDLASRYGSTDTDELASQIADSAGVSRRNVTVGSGSTQILHMLSEVALSGGGNVVIGDPTFWFFETFAREFTGKIKRVKLTDDLKLDLDEMRAAVDEQTKIVWICNPNNPTATTLGEDSIKALAESLPEGVVAAVDEAYLEFRGLTPAEGAAKLVKDGANNVAAIRTFSKAHALAGVRIGYCIAPLGLTMKLRGAKDPYNVNRVGAAAAAASLGDPGHVEKARKHAEQQKAYLASGLGAMGLRVLPSDAIFVLVDLGRDCQPVAAELAKRRILVRSAGQWGMPNCIRVSVGTAEENARLVEALKEIVSQGV